MSSHTINTKRVSYKLGRVRQIHFKTNQTANEFTQP